MTFASLLDRFSHLRAVIVGDVMLDSYIFGEAARISPEAPVMVIRHRSDIGKPGGAANVARNVRALGAQASILGVVGSDEPGKHLRRLLTDEGFGDSGLIEDPDRPTTNKTRILADGSHQVLRIDREETSPIGNTAAERLLDALRASLREADVLILSDYRKGALSGPLIEAAISEAEQRGVPVVANAKPATIQRLAGSTLITLNRSEATEYLRLEESVSDTEAISAARDIRESAACGGVLVTLGSAGMAYSGKVEHRIEAHLVEVADPAGAGDTVAASVSLGVAAAGEDRAIFELAARTAACVVRHVGVATPSPADIQELRALSGIL